MTQKITCSRKVAVVAGALALALASGNALAGPNCSVGNPVSRTGKVKRLNVVGLTADGRLVCFTDKAPDKAATIAPVSGLGSADAALIGIDFRPQDGLLYGVGSGGGVYTIDTTTGQATFVNQLTETLRPAGERDIDFNPAADRLRIVGDTGQNLRHNVNAGGTTIADGDLNYTAGMTAMGIVGAAYTNNDLQAMTGTSLFDLDANLDQVAIQSPPNAGSLVATGKLGIDAGSPAGFDMFSATVGGVTVSNHGFAAFTVGGVSAFYRVDPLTGTATFVKPFSTLMADIAVPIAVEP